MTAQRPRRKPPQKARPRREPEAEVLAPASPEESEDKWDLRPKRFEECIGQAAVVEALHIAIQAAKERGDTLDHVLFHGPPGLGKTTFAAHHRHRARSAV